MRFYVYVHACVYVSNLHKLAIFAPSGVTLSAQGALQTAHIDDNAAGGRTALYLGVAQGVHPLGPVLAFLLGGVFLTLPEDLTSGERECVRDATQA